MVGVFGARDVDGGFFLLFYGGNIYALDIISGRSVFLGKAEKGINITAWLTFGVLTITTALVIIPSIGLGSGGWIEVFD